jgi:hypothetical protein
MAKLVSHEDDVLVYEVLQLWTFREHEVALMRLTNKAVPESAASYLMCECDFAEGPRVHGGPNDPHACEAKKVVRNVAVMNGRIVHGDAWKKMGLKESIFDIKRRVEADEYLGQHVDRCVYTQEVAELLGLDHEKVLVACGELYAEERLDLNGRILTDFVPGFRFPWEMATTMLHIVEEPLGWPNGDAGDCWLSGFEKGVQQRLGFTSGKQAFGRHWPRIDGIILAGYALEPVAAKLRQVAPLVPDGPMTAETTALLAIDAMGDATIGESLRRLEATQPEIAAKAFGEFIRALFLLAFERIEIDQAMRTEMVPPAQTLREMADWLDRVAAEYRAQAKEA